MMHGDALHGAWDIRRCSEVQIAFLVATHALTDEGSEWTRPTGSPDMAFHFTLLTVSVPAALPILTVMAKFPGSRHSTGRLWG